MLPTPRKIIMTKKIEAGTRMLMSLLCLFIKPLELPIWPVQLATSKTTKHLPGQNSPNPSPEDKTFSLTSPEPKKTASNKAAEVHSNSQGIFGEFSQKGGLCVDSQVSTC
jgi:hypothetical protein